MPSRSPASRLPLLRRPTAAVTYQPYFFFSRTRRHTRWPRDWSSDVCSSDLWLEKQGYSAAQIARAMDVLGQDLGHTGRDLYHDNQAVYERLRYGVPVKTEAGRVNESVFLIDWDNPTNNDFGIAEEVTLRGGHERRPDLVLYINGIAVAVIELKSSRVGIGEGIRQLLSNQTPAFNADFFRTVQLVFAGSDSEGLKYGTIGTPEKFFLRWKEDEDDSQGFRLDKYLAKMCRDRKSTRLNSSHVAISYAVFCLKKKKM